MKKVKRHKKRAKALFRKPPKAKTKPVRRRVRALKRDLAKVAKSLPRQAPAPAAAADSPRPKRVAPTSLRFSARDEEMMTRLKDRWKLDGRIAVLRRAMEVAEASI